MQLRSLNVGCFGGGTGLPSLLGGLKSNPWLTVNAVVTMFDSGGSSGQLRDELGVLPPGDVLKCALALARNEREARRVLLSRMPLPEHVRLARSYQRQSAAVDDGAVQRRLRRRGQRPVRAARLPRTGVAGQHGAGDDLRRVWRRLDARAAKWRSMPGSPPATRSSASGSSLKSRCMNRPRARSRIRRGRDRSGQLLHQPAADLSREGLAGRDSGSQGPGDPRDEPADRGQRHGEVHRRRSSPSDQRRHRPPGRCRAGQHRRRPARKRSRGTAQEHKTPLPIGDIPSSCEVVLGEFWCGDIARHDRRRLATAVWAVLARRML